MARENFCAVQTALAVLAQTGVFAGEPYRYGAQLRKDAATRAMAIELPYATAAASCASAAS